MANVLSLQRMTGVGKATTTAARLRKLKKFAITMLAAATVAFGSVATSPTASAMSCTTAQSVSTVYRSMGEVFLAMGNTAWAAAYFARANGVLEGACM